MKRFSAIACVFWASACDPIVTSIGAYEPDLTSNPYIEAESGELSGGFAIGEDASASGGRVLLPPTGVTSEDVPGSARARYTFRVAEAGFYSIWGRIHGPSAMNNRFWFQVDAGAWTKWRISTGEVWFWDDLHRDTDYDSPQSFSLAVGSHELVIANCVEGVALDRLYITLGSEAPPGNETACDPPHSIQLQGTCVPSCGSLQGTTCGTEACRGYATLPAYDCDVCCQVP